MADPFLPVDIAYAMKRLITAIVLCAGFAGCASTAQPYVNETRLERGLVVVLSGIEGRGPLTESICRGLDEGGVDLAIENYSWAVPMGLVINQRGEYRNRRRATELADRIVKYRTAYPDRPVYIVGQSGGGAMAAWTAEGLPPGIEIDGIVMIAPSLSPEYMLDRALTSSRGGIVNFHSSNDWLLLGLGTTLAGTMDGKHTASAGKTGFDVPSGAFRSRRKAYRKLYQVPWEPAMAEMGNSGGHMSSGARRFVAAYVAPLLQSRSWSRQAIDRTLAAARTRASSSTFVRSDSQR